MADELPPGVQSLEDDAPAAIPAPAPPAPIAAAPVAPAEPVPEPEDPDVVEVGGQKMVPVSALIAERGKRQAVTDRAALADKLEQQWAEARPYIEFVRNNPQLLQRQAPQPLPVPQGAPPPDPDVVAYAQTLSLYKPDGTPDLESAGRLLGIAERRAGQQAQRAVQPLMQQTVQQQSETNFRVVLTNLKDADGRTPSEQHLRAVWNAVGPQATADPNVAGMLGLMAMGADRTLTKSPVAPPAVPALITEASGGQQRPRAAMTGLEASIADERKIAPKQWQELTANFTAHRPSKLED